MKEDVLLLLNDRGAYITGSDILIDGATASYFFGPLRP